MACSNSDLPKEKYDSESQKLILRAMREFRKLCALANKKRKQPNPIEVLEIGLGYGDMTVRLIKECRTNGYVYHGLDCSLEVVENVCDRLLKAGEEFDSSKVVEGWSDQLKFGSGSLSVVIWGRIGHHIPSDKVWAGSLEQAKRVLEPGGYFLQFEALLDFNHEDIAKPRRHEFTQLRFMKDYVVSLDPLQLVRRSKLTVGDEIYTIAVWQKPT